MPQRIIRPCIFAGMKPHELIAALMHKEGLGALPLAKKMGKPKLQPQIHRYIRGTVNEPARTTAEPLAAYFKIPVDALYSERIATEIAKERGVSALPAALAAATPKKKSPKTPDFDADTVKFAAQYQKLSPSERHKLRLLLNVAKTGANPGETWRAPTSDASSPVDLMLGGDSGLGELDEAPAAKKGGKK